MQQTKLRQRTDIEERLKPVLRIRIPRIRMFLGLLDPDPEVLGGTDPESGSFYHQAKIVRKPLISTVL